MRSCLDASTAMCPSKSVSVELKSAAGQDDAEVLAIISAAVGVLLSSRPPSQSPLEQDVPNWRFSGRWWNEPIAVRRSHPFRT